MEVHHHTNTPRRKWTHYFWEFLMLFLAVFCGFLAEYALEHKIEKDREKQYMISMIKDLKTDIDNMTLSAEEKENKVRLGDSITRAFLLTNYKEQSGDLYYNARSFSTFKNAFLMTDGTLMQLKNSGGLRLVRSLLVVDSLQAYDNMYQQFLQTQDNEIEYLMGYRDIMGKIFDIRVFDQMIKTYPGVIRPEGNPPLFNTDKQLVNELLVKIHLAKRTKLAEIYYLNQLKAKAANLIGLIKKEYHMEE